MNNVPFSPKARQRAARILQGTVKTVRKERKKGRMTLEEGSTILRAVQSEGERLGLMRPTGESLVSEQTMQTETGIFFGHNLRSRR